MGDQAALQEAIQRARQLAAKISQNAPATKRPASELDDSHSIGTVKVTLAYEKPVNSDNQKQQQESTTHHRSSSSHRDNNSNYSNKDSNHSSSLSRDRESSRDDHPRDRDSAYSGSNGSNAYPSSRSTNQQPMAGYGSMLGGASNNSYSGGSADAKIEIIIPVSVIGLVIGKGGENIKRIQNETGATVRVDPNTVDEKGNKVCTITGTKEAVEEAHSQVANVIENAATNKRPRTQVEGSDQYRMKIPASRTGAIIGKGGETIKSIKQQSGCDIELDKGAKECGPDESVFVIRGTQDKILKARAMIEARLASRGRDGDNPRSNAPMQPKGVATGANAAPVAQFTDLPNNYAAAAGQQNSADTQAAWAAYFAQYSNMFNQAGAQPGATNLPYAGQNLMGAGAQPVPQLDPSLQQKQQQQHQQQQPQQPQVQAPQQGAQPQQDYTDQWIEFYLMNGRPDYAEQIIEMKKQQQQQQQAHKQQQPPQPK